MTCDNVCVHRAMEIYGMDCLSTDFIDAQASDNIYVQRAGNGLLRKLFSH